ncbi:helix-turn-helix domain-containing protein [Streptococcus ruminicola]|uniref:Helix-turn-helix domain-containing protein n=1 Tax=Streptococcus ruminicola TaxID=2686210 RepID=A0A6G8I083_9STRE|nr:AraC family transcriptional regulator [Streptococcus ruminicola]QGZ28287.1 helix-turn-helix domain-containing protein [Streptococcus ruminicola]QIM46522.1 helix-turn-helix domain-containing protein [Streptococcus ruminicola]WFM81524.1 AraC family transcriptional regulator [Streptococcus ruminicola]
MNILNTYNEFDTNNFDLNVDHYGAEICDKNYSFGPTVRDNYVLHFIVDGKGSFKIDGTTTELKTGDMFILPKGKVTFYQADSKHPWTYLWVGFSGSKAENILSKTQLLDHYFCHSTLESKVLDQIVKLTQFRDQKLDDVTELQLIAELYKLLAFLMEELPSKSMSDSNILIQNYIKQTKKIIHTQYSKTLKVSQIAKKLNLNRSYLYKIFKEETGYSIKDYLGQIRMEKSADLLINTTFHISEVANAVGFPDALAFSKAFKKHFGQSPSNYRKALKK